MDVTVRLKAEDSMATKARLHWFWRGMIAAVVGAACLVGVSWPLDARAEIMKSLDALLQRAGLTEFWGYASIVLLMGIGPVTVGIVVFSVLGQCFGPVTADGELHCRRCDHILRGLSEPRCPECGEAI